MTKHIVQFNATASYQQEIEIVDPNVTIEHLLMGLNLGDYVTTLQWSSDQNAEQPSISPIDHLNHTTAIIHSGCAELFGHSQYTDFKLIESDDSE